MECGENLTKFTHNVEELEHVEKVMEDVSWHARELELNNVTLDVRKVLNQRSVNDQLLSNEELEELYVPKTV